MLDIEQPADRLRHIVFHHSPLVWNNLFILLPSRVFDPADEPIQWWTKQERHQYKDECYFLPSDRDHWFTGDDSQK